MKLQVFLCGFFLIVGAANSAVAESANRKTDSTRMVILGIDGMDPEMLRSFMAEGVMPNFSRLAEQGGFIKLGTSVPPQSPVAWSNLITGMDSGGHGIFDFIALDRKSLLPYQSTSKTEQPDTEPLSIGKWRIPLASGKTLQMRDGQAFWEILEQNGVNTTMVTIPANYPPIETGGKAISGMGTPDMRGTSGTFSFYTNSPEFKAGKVSGGEIYRVDFDKHAATASIYGPPNPFLAENPLAETRFGIHVDPENPVALIHIDDHRVLLNEGEWSDWVTVNFELMPGLVSVQGMVRFLLKQVQPYFSLYASPVNIDPREPAQPIATPAEYAFELAEAAGPFYTQEMPEDTKALSAHVLSPREFVAQSELVLDERKRLLKSELKRFRDTPGSALLFFYFSSVDQRNHMLARQMDPSHPFHDKDTPSDLAMAMKNLYLEMDEILGRVMQELQPGTSLIVMSDHGFAPFKRQANLNTWLEQNGFLTLKNPAKRDEYEWLFGIDWRKTKAFAIGLNSLYLNVKGRDRYGIVDPADRAALAREIADKLKQWRDGPNGEYVVTQPLLREEVYHGSHVEEAPDILVGYSRGYRASWATTSGKIPSQLVEDNDHEWSGDHCMDSRAVPGILLSNEALKTEMPSDLKDLTVSILDRFGIEPPSQMKGHSVF